MSTGSCMWRVVTYHKGTVRQSGAMDIIAATTRQLWLKQYGIKSMLVADRERQTLRSVINMGS